jgi:hypothetical protein
MAAVRTLLLIRARKDTVLHPFPRDAMMVLFAGSTHLHFHVCLTEGSQAMSRSANPSPFHPYPFPFINKGEANDY